jgi:hypothetical protein
MGDDTEDTMSAMLGFGAPGGQSPTARVVPVHSKGCGVYRLNGGEVRRSAAARRYTGRNDELIV